MTHRDYQSALQSLSPLADAVLAFLRGEEDAHDATSAYAALVRARRAGAFAGLEPEAITVRGVRGAMAVLDARGLIVLDRAGWRVARVEIEAAAPNPQGTLFGE